jgi:glycosyltransferase involved in cell wall biosynthesis
MRVSIVITCYNYARFLPAAINSALAQTHADVELIVVNDGSTDETDAVMRRYASNSRVRYLVQKNAGQANAKNRGIRAAEGEFIAFLDADDVWRSDKLEKQLPLFNDPKVGVVYSRMRSINEEGAPVAVEPAPATLSPKRGEVTRDLYLDNFIPFSSSVVRRECLTAVGPIDESLSMGIDWDLWLRASVSWRFDFVNEPLLDYRVGHAAQMSRNVEERQACSDRIMTKFVREHPRALSPTIVRDAWSYTYNRRGYYFRPLDLRKSTDFYRRALREKPLQAAAYFGLAKNALYWLAVRFSCASKWPFKRAVL